MQSATHKHSKWPQNGLSSDGCDSTDSSQQHLKFCLVLSTPWNTSCAATCRALFTLAHRLAPAVIFVDEVDSMLSRRDKTGEHEVCLSVSPGGRSVLIDENLSVDPVACGCAGNAQDQERNHVTVVSCCNHENSPAVPSHSNIPAPARLSGAGKRASNVRLSLWRSQGWAPHFTD